MPYHSVWNFIFDMLDITPSHFAEFKWVPGHMDTQHKKDKYQHLIRSGQITQHDILGNQLVDQYAERGTNMHNISRERLTSTYDRVDFIELIHQHSVCSWHNWIVYAGSESQDKDVAVNLENLAHHDDQQQDFQTS